MMMRLFRTWLVIAVCGFSLYALTPTQAYGQSEPGSCNQTRTGLEGGRVRQTDLQEIANCRVSGPPAIAKLWPRTQVTGETELSALVATSVALSDGRVYGSVAATAADASQPTNVRLAALQVLAAYYRPDLRPSMEYLKSPHDKVYIFRSAARATHSAEITGVVPLPRSRKVDIPELLARLAHGDHDPVIKGAALHLRQDLAALDPKNTPVDADRIDLKAGCGPRVTLESTEDIPLQLRVRVLGTPFDRTYALNKSGDGKAKKLPLALPAGTVVVTYTGKEVARLTERNAPCPQGVTRG